MRGDYLHNAVLIGRVEQAFVSKGWSTRQELYVSAAPCSGFIDLVATRESTTIAVEAELSPRRVRKDIWKARIFGASELWIVVPNVRVANNVRMRIPENGGPNTPAVFVLTLGQALYRVTHSLPIKTTPNGYPVRKVNK